MRKTSQHVLDANLIKKHWPRDRAKVIELHKSQLAFKDQVIKQKNKQIEFDIEKLRLLKMMASEITWKADTEHYSKYGGDGGEDGDYTELDYSKEQMDKIRRISTEAMSICKMIR